MIELDPKHARAHHSLGIARAAQGEYDEAIRDFQRAIKFDPKDADELGVSGIVGGLDFARVIS